MFGVGIGRATLQHQIAKVGAVRTEARYVETETTRTRWPLHVLLQSLEPNRGTGLEPRIFSSRRFCEQSLAGSVETILISVMLAIGWFNK